MSGSAESASKADRVVVIGLNWLGDAVMSMPALQRLRRMRTDWHLAVCTRPHLADLWRMHAAVDEILIAPRGGSGWRRLRQGRFDRAFVQPNSFSSAWLPWRARIPERVGFRGQWRT